MSEAPPTPASGAPDAAEQQRTALFASLVMQQANMALTFLGKGQHGDAESPGVDLPTASMFIDTLEMLEARTRGNLSPEEAGLLKQTLTTLRISFVQASSSPAAKAPSPSPAEPAAPPAEPSADSVEPGQTAAAQDAEARRKFVKRY